MPIAGALPTFTANTRALAEDITTAFAALRDTLNTYGLLTDVARTVTVTNTWSLTQTFTGGWTAGAACTVSTGGLTVTAGGITVTGNSTITGTLGGVTTLTATTLGGTLSTAAQPNVTSVGTLTGLAVAGAVTVTTATTTLAATAAGYASLNLPHGTAPSSPANGDVWTTTGGLYARINSATQGPYLEAATVRPGLYSGGSANQQPVALTQSAWTPLAGRQTNSTTGTNPPQFDGDETTLTVNEAGWYAVWARASVTAGTPTSLGLAIVKTSGAGQASAAADTAPEVHLNHWGGYSSYPTYISGLLYLAASATVEVQAYTGTAGVTAQLENYAIVRVA